MRQLKRYGVMGLWGFWVFGLWGCALLTQAAKGFYGVSTQTLEDNRKHAIKITFNYDYNTCYNKVEEVLKEMGAYVYARDIKKQMIAIYLSEKDTTPVGLFFKTLDATQTQIEVSSPSTYAKEFMATKTYAALTLKKEEKDSTLKNETKD